jgi:hypothetical protein|nr:MAG TPA_asm: hypothetical protein [Caudoviricetes sp.]
MKTINVYKAENAFSRYQLAGTKNIRKEGKVEFLDGSRWYTRNAYVAEDGSIWVKLCGQFHVLDSNSSVSFSFPQFPQVVRYNFLRNADVYGLEKGH